MLTKPHYLDTLPQKDFRKNKERILKHEIGENGSGFPGGNNENISKVKFSASLKLPKTDKNHKTREYLSTLEVCRILGIDHKTYRRQEGKLFPKPQRDPENRYRIFTQEQVNELKKLWHNRVDYYKKNRHYHYHKTGSFYSLPEACKIIGISTETYKDHEGKIFPLAQQDHAGRRLFTEKDIQQIKKTWENHKKRNNHHPTLSEHF